MIKNHIIEHEHTQTHTHITPQFQLKKFFAYNCRLLTLGSKKRDMKDLSILTRQTDVIEFQC